MNDLALLGTELCYSWEAAPTSAIEIMDNPAVFRWVVRDSGTGRIVEVFFGETPRLGSPAATCGGTEDSDCCTIHESLRHHRAKGRDIRLEVLHFTHFEVAGHYIAPAELTDRSVRRLLTNLFAFQHTREGHRVLDA